MDRRVALSLRFLGGCDGRAGPLAWAVVWPAQPVAASAVTAAATAMDRTSAMSV